MPTAVGVVLFVVVVISHTHCTHRPAARGDRPNLGRTDGERRHCCTAAASFQRCSPAKPVVLPASQPAMSASVSPRAPAAALHCRRAEWNHGHHDIAASSPARRDVFHCSIAVCQYTSCILMPARRIFCTFGTLPASRDAGRYSENHTVLRQSS